MVASWYKGNDVKGFFAQANGHQVTRELLPASVWAPLHSFFFPPSPAAPFIMLRRIPMNLTRFSEMKATEQREMKKERKEKLGE